MANSIPEPWILSYLISVGETYGASLSNVPFQRKKKRARLATFLTFPGPDDDTFLWARVSDHSDELPARFSKEAIADYMRQNRKNPLTACKGALVTINNFRPIFSRVPMGNGINKMSPDSRLALEIGQVHVVGSIGEVPPSATDIEANDKLNQWTLGLREDGDGGNVLKRMKEARGLSAPNTLVTTSPEKFAGASRQARPAVKKPTKATGRQAPNGLTVVPRLPTRAQITNKLSQKTLSKIGLTVCDKPPDHPEQLFKLFPNGLSLSDGEYTPTSPLESRGQSPGRNHSPLQNPKTPNHRSSPCSKPTTPSHWSPSSQGSDSSNIDEAEDDPEIGMPDCPPEDRSNAGSDRSSEPSSDSVEHIARLPFSPSGSANTSFPLQPASTSQISTATTKSRDFPAPTPAQRSNPNAKPTHTGSSPPTSSSRISTLPFVSSSSPPLSRGTFNPLSSSPLHQHTQVERKVPYPSFRPSIPDPDQSKVLVPNSDTSGTASQTRTQEIGVVSSAKILSGLQSSQSRSQSQPQSRSQPQPQSPSQPLPHSQGAAWDRLQDFSKEGVAERTRFDSHDPSGIPSRKVNGSHLGSNAGTSTRRGLFITSKNVDNHPPLDYPGHGSVDVRSDLRKGFRPGAGAPPRVQTEDAAGSDPNIPLPVDGLVHTELNEEDEDDAETDAMLHALTSPEPESDGDQDDSATDAQLLPHARIRKRNDTAPVPSEINNTATRNTQQANALDSKRRRRSLTVGPVGPELTSSEPTKKASIPVSTSIPTPDGLRLHDPLPWIRPSFLGAPNAGDVRRSTVSGPLQSHHLRPTVQYGPHLAKSIHSSGVQERSTPAAPARLDLRMMSARKRSRTSGSSESISSGSIKRRRVIEVASGIGSSNSKQLGMSDSRDIGSTSKTGQQHVLDVKDEPSDIKLKSESEWSLLPKKLNGFRVNLNKVAASTTRPPLPTYEDIRISLLRTGRWRHTEFQDEQIFPTVPSR